MSLAPLSAAGLTSSASATAGVNVIDEARAPASVRDGSKTVKQAYASAQGFEEMLLQQLSQSLVKSSGLAGGSEAGGEGSSEEGSLGAGSEASSGMLSSMLPQTLTEGVMNEGGLGLATQLMGTLDPSAAATASPGPTPSGAPSALGATGGLSGPASPAPAAATGAAPDASVGRAGGTSA